jgi:hypothetical protein
MATDRPERQAKQLFGHWSARGDVTEQDGALTQRWADGQVFVLRPVEGALASDPGLGHVARRGP